MSNITLIKLSNISVIYSVIVKTSPEHQNVICGLTYFPIALYSETVLQHQISYSQYSALENEQLVNLAVVITDMATQKLLIASKEFNINFPFIRIQVQGPG